MAAIDPRILHIAESVPGGFSFWNFLYHRREGAEVALAYARVFWPELVMVEGFVFLSENYDREYFDRVVSDYGGIQVEATINTTYLDELFGAGPIDADESVWCELGNVVGQCWKARAQSLFPSMRFATTFQWYSDDGDPGVTLFQERYAVDRTSSDSLQRSTERGGEGGNGDDDGDASRR